MVSDAAELIREGVVDGRAEVAYSIRGWEVILSALVEAAVAPDHLTVHAMPGTDVTTDGVTTEVLRAVPLADARQRLASLKAQASASLPAPPIKQRLEGERDWAEFAKLYADLVQAGHRHPLQVMARQSGISRHTLGARVRRAREAGYLTRPNGHTLALLTDRAETLLKDG